MNLNEYFVFSPEKAILLSLLLVHFEMKFSNCGGIFFARNNDEYLNVFNESIEKNFHTQFYLF